VHEHGENQPAAEPNDALVLVPENVLQPPLVRFLGAALDRATIRLRTRAAGPRGGRHRDDGEPVPLEGVDDVTRPAALERWLNRGRAVPATVHDDLERVPQADRAGQSGDERAGYDGMARDDTQVPRRCAGCIRRGDMRGLEGLSGLHRTL